MFLTSSLLHLPTLKPHPSPFLHGSSTSTSTSLLPKPTTTTSAPPSSIPFTIQAMKKMQGRVVCATNDKTVAVEVVRLAPHPKYKRRVRKKKKYQAHDPDNQFKVGDYVQLERSSPISKTKAFIAIPVAPRNAPKAADQVAEGLGIQLQSQQMEA